MRSPSSSETEVTREDGCRVPAEQWRALQFLRRPRSVLGRSTIDDRSMMTQETIGDRLYGVPDL